MGLVMNLLSLPWRLIGYGWEFSKLAYKGQKTWGLVRTEEDRKAFDEYYKKEIEELNRKYKR